MIAPYILLKLLVLNTNVLQLFSMPYCLFFWSEFYFTNTVLSSQYDFLNHHSGMSLPFFIFIAHLPDFSIWRPADLHILLTIQEDCQIFRVNLPNPKMFYCLTPCYPIPLQSRWGRFQRFLKGIRTPNLNLAAVNIASRRYVHNIKILPTKTNIR